MSKSYVIQWKSKVNGRAGRGSRMMPREEAEHLAAELNREYPDILHESVPAQSPVAPSGGGPEEPRETSTHPSPRRPAHSLSTH